jgi:hypothetical protein
MEQKFQVGDNLNTEDPKVKVYEVGGKTLEMRKLVLGQIQRLAGLFSPYLEQLNSISNDTQLSNFILKLLSDGKLSAILACVLREKGQNVSEVKINELQLILENNLDVDLAFKMVQDFFEVGGTQLSGFVGVAPEQNQTQEEVQSQ